MTNELALVGCYAGDDDCNDYDDYDFFGNYHLVEFGIARLYRSTPPEWRARARITYDIGYSYFIECFEKDLQEEEEEARCTEIKQPNKAKEPI